MASFLIGVGIGSLMVTAVNYKEKNYRGLIPTKYITLIGIVALLAGLTRIFI